MIDGADHRTSESSRSAVRGAVLAGFEPVRDELARMVDADPTYSAQFCAYVGGEAVVDIWGGSLTDGDAVQGVFSATKGMAAICLGLLIERGELELDDPVAEYWSEFGQAGKAGITVRLALSHQAGLIGVDEPLTLDRLIDHEGTASLLAAQAPFWQPGSAHGYHALTMGTLVDELVRRVDGRSVADFFEQEIAIPRDIDFFIAVREADEPRVIDVLPVADQSGSTAATTDVGDQMDASSLSGVAFSASALDPFNPPLPNLRVIRAAGVAAAGGVGSARGLARAYASCIGEVDDMPRLLGPATVAEMSRLQTAGTDLVLGFPTRFAIVFQVADERLAYGSWRAFGHDGAGGAIGVADPAFRLAYGYIPRRMCSPGGADPRGLALASITRRCIAARRP
jgi:CubicO group peptidase (beta-lactamase class C family)